MRMFPFMLIIQSNCLDLEGCYTLDVTAFVSFGVFLHASVEAFQACSAVVMQAIFEVFVSRLKLITFVVVGTEKALEKQRNAVVAKHMQGGPVESVNVQSYSRFFFFFVQHC